MMIMCDYRRFRSSFPILLLLATLLLAPGCFAQRDAARDSTGKAEKNSAEDDMDNALSPSAPSSPRLRPKAAVGESMGGGTGYRAGSGTGMGYTAPSVQTLGATIGGAKDIGYARKLIEAGKVPQFIDFSPEGLYGEHDIPTPAGACDRKLCLSLGYGYAPTADNQSNALFIHLGMSSNIRPEEFRRSALDLALVIDKSGSMQGESMEAVKKALRSLAGRLTAGDRITIIAFDDEAELLLPATSGDRLERILAAIDSLVPDGGTDIEEGLQLGFDALSAHPADPSRSRRLMLFTDAVPNAGRTDSTSFRILTERYASLGIGLTAFGVGVDFGQQLIYHISQLRGGNFFFLESPEKIARVFDTEFDYLVTPLVYDLRVKIETPPGMKLTAVYGLPTWKPGSRDAELHVPTVFLSSNRGAIVLRYEKDGTEPLAIAGGEDLAYGTLGFTDVDGRGHTERTVLRHTGTSALEPGT